jgi:hypothetical protein
MIASETTPMPGEILKVEKMPGNWLLVEGSGVSVQTAPRP